MPKLSLWNPVKKNDYKFVDGIVAENIYVGGTGVNVHKYLGVHDQGDTNDFTLPQQDNQYDSEGNQKTVTAVYGGINAAGRVYVAGCSAGDFVTYNWEANAEL